MKNIYLIILLLTSFGLSAQTIDGRKNTSLHEKTSLDSNDIIIVGDYPVGTWNKMQYKNVVKHSTYTPTGAAITNVATVTPTVSYYSKVGSWVQVWGEVTIDPSNTVGASEVTLTFPFASNVAQTYEVSGIARNNDSTSIRVLGSVSGDKASFKWYAKDTTSKSFSYSFNYHIN